MDTYDYPMEELELGVRIYNILKRMGVVTIGDVMQVSVQDLNTYTLATGVAVGLKSAKQLAEVQQWVRDYNY